MPTHSTCCTPGMPRSSLTTPSMPQSVSCSLLDSDAPCCLRPFSDLAAFCHGDPCLSSDLSAFRLCPPYPVSAFAAPPTRLLALPLSLPRSSLFPVSDPAALIPAPRFSAVPLTRPVRSLEAWVCPSDLEVFSVQFLKGALGLCHSFAPLFFEPSPLQFFSA